MSNLASSKHLSHPKYRADVDGLRAVAVLSVVGYHAFPNLIQGGFIGVDIFFVISGFLISTIIFSNLAQENFTFAEFYSRRIRRIFPALLVILATCLVIGWFTLTGGEYAQLGKHILSGAGFVSNITFWRESGYFDAAAETKILLHLWSLGVEEQYYILWPPILWLAWKKRFNLLAVTLLLLAISFVVNVVKVYQDATAAFFLPHTRFWEMLVGSALAYITLHQQDLFPRLKISTTHEIWLRNFQSLLGAGLITAGLTFIIRDLDFPGWWALLPTFGAMLIISAGAQAWINRTLLSNRILVWFGLISYPLYLWHWPLLTFLRITQIEPPSSLMIVSVVLLSILLAWLTYKYVEIPIRTGNKSPKQIYLLATLMVIVGVSGYLLYANKGFQGYGYRTPEKSAFENYFDNTAPEWHYFETTGILDKFHTECDFYDIASYRVGQPTLTPRASISSTCYTRDPNKKHTLFLWGDSHAQQLYYGLINNLPRDWQILMVASSGCVPDPDAQENSATDYCQRSNWFALKTIKEIKPEVVIAARESGYTVGLINKLGSTLLKSGANRVIIPGPTPQWTKNLPNLILRGLWDNTPERTFVGFDKNIMDKNSQLKAQIPKRKNLTFVDLIGVFCNSSGCLTRIGNDKMTDITSWDKSHLTPLASDYLAKKLLVPLIVNPK